MTEHDSAKKRSFRRATAVLASLTMSTSLVACAEQKPQDSQEPRPTGSCAPIEQGEQIRISPDEVICQLGTLAVKGLAPKTGYDRDRQFGSGWRESHHCSTRETVLIRDMTDEVVDQKTCAVESGDLHDVYSGKDLNDLSTSDIRGKIEIDHVVALSNAWQTGAQQLTKKDRTDLANDPLNLQATEEKNNRQKSDSDAASWLPGNRGTWCRYVARQVLVKQRYHLWVKPAEHDRIEDILDDCPKGELITVPN